MDRAAVRPYQGRLRQRLAVPALNGVVGALHVNVGAKRRHQCLGLAVQPLVEKGFKGAELGEALQRERLKALSAYKAASGNLKEA